MSEEVKKSAASKKAESGESATLLKQLHDEILAYLNSAHIKKSDDLIAKMSLGARSLARVA